MSQNDDLRRFADAATNAAYAPTTDDYEDDFEDEEPEEETTADTPEETPAGWDAWVATLSAEDLERGRDDPQWVEYQWGLLQARADFEAAHHPDGSDEAKTEPEPGVFCRTVSWPWTRAVRPCASSTSSEMAKTPSCA